MAKSLLRLKARKLRKRGVSVKKIASLLGVAKSTASLWVRDIILTIEQLEDLHEISLKGAELGRLRGALAQKRKRLLMIDYYKEEGSGVIARLTNRDLLIAGVALYWGEGSRKKRSVEFCNSDPEMVKFLLAWFTKCFNVSKDRFICRVDINQIHAVRDQVVREYWSKLADIPLSQFKRTSLKKVNNKKIYDNFNEHYGTFRVIVSRPGMLYYKIMGLIYGLAWQGSKVG